jgi:hypothetical protein
MTILPCFVVKLRMTPGCVGLALDFNQPSLRISFDGVPSAEWRRP